MFLRSCSTLVALTALLLSSHMLADEQQRLRYAIIYSDPDGRTHFRDEFIPWLKAQSTDPKHPVGAMQTPFVDAQKLGFLTLPRGYSSAWHPAPGKRFVLVLSGLLEVEVGSGERRKFGPGDVLLVTDVEGRGHITRALGKQAVAAWVPVP